MKEIELLKEVASNLAIPNTKNRASLYVAALLPTINQALQAGLFKKDIWRILVDLGLFGENSYSSFMRILDKTLEKSQPTRESKTLTEANSPPSIEKKLTIKTITPDSKPKTEVKKAHEPLKIDIRSPSFTYNPIPNKDDLI